MASRAPIDFYFDFSSPYGHFAAREIDAIGARYGRSVAWYPFMLGPIFKQAEMPRMVDQPLKAPYIKRDWDRIARDIGIPFVLGDPFPFAALAPSRAFYWICDQDPTAAKAFALDVYDQRFVKGNDVTDVDRVVELAVGQGANGSALAAALGDPDVKQRLKDETETAIGRGVLGSPFFIVDDEPFWGYDRLPMLERWLSRGGW